MIIEQLICLKKITTMKKKFKAKEREIRATIEMTCFTHHGIQGIKNVLIQLQSAFSTLI